MNNGIGKSIFQRINGGSGLPFMKQNQQIRGILVEKNGQSIRIDTGNKRLMELKLNREIEAKAGEPVVIDKKDILHSQRVEGSNSPLKQEEIGIYSRILQSFNLPVKNELLDGLKTLDMQGLQLSKENLLTLMTSKNQLDYIMEGLDYDTAIGLMEQEVDIEAEPINKLASTLEEVKEKGNAFSITRYLKEQFNITTEEAERIATELYGSKMGKDYTDIIKALNKAGIEITRKNIDRINDIFSKLHQLKDLGEETIIGSLKNKLETSIDNLVKLKNAVTKGIVAADEKISRLASRLYEVNAHRGETVSERDLQLLEKEIKEQLSKEGYSPTKENIRLAKELIKAQLPVSSENIAKVNAVKEAIKELGKELDAQKLGELIKNNVNIEKESVTSLVELLKGLEEANPSGGMEALTQQQKEDIKSILNSLQGLKSIKEEDLITLIKRGIEFKLGDIENLTRADSKLLKAMELEPKHMVTYNAVTEVSQALNQIRPISFNSIAFHLDNNYAMTLEGFAKSNGLFINNSSYGGNKELEGPELLRLENTTLNNIHNTEVIRALINQKLPVNQYFADRLQQIKGQLSFISDGITSNTLVKSLEDGISIARLELDKAVGLIKEYNGADKVATLQETIPVLPANRQHLLAMLMKNAMPMSLKSIKELSMLFNNRSNITQDVKELVELIGKDSKADVALAARLQATIKELGTAAKQGKMDADRFYEELDKAIRLIQEGTGQMDKEARKALENKIDRIKENLEAQQQLNKNDTCFQLPVFMKEELRNLQIYVMNKKKNTKRIDAQNMSILLNMETASVGNLCIYVAVTNKNVMLKIGLDQPEYKKIVEPQSKVLIGLMKDIGYDVKEVGFRVNEEETMLDMLNHTEHEESMMKHFIDMKI